MLGLTCDRSGVDERGTGKIHDTSTPHEQKGVGTAHFDRHHNSQKPGEPNAAGKAFSQATLGTGRALPDNSSGRL